MKNTRFHVLFLILTVFAISASAKDEWLQVRSNNFNLVGNASEKDIRKVATKLEQFRETFRLLFTQTNLSSPIPTNVVVFKSDSAYKPFKPKRADGKADNFIAGYFQSGEDVNYITLSTEGNDTDTYGTIFHEYVHFIVNTNFGKSEVPPWFNEGLAEYYQTFVMEEDIRAKLGLPQDGHLALLQQNKIIPLDTFFNISNAALHQNGDHSRSIFYAQAWAIIHYFIANKKNEAMSNFLTLSLKNVPEEKAFQEAFQMTYAQMERELRKYVEQNSYKYTTVTFKTKLNFDTEMKTSVLSEADSNAYLGDLLFHTHRPDDAEPFLQNALAQKPDSSMANTSLGMVKVSQRKYQDAKNYLEKAISQDPKNHLAYYQYASLLSREGRDEFGYVESFPKEKTTRIRELLKKAIALNPAFTESYELLAFVSLVSNEGLDEAVVAMRKALAYQPGSQRYVMRIAEIYMRQEKFDEASEIANRITKTTDEPVIKNQADHLLEQIARGKEINAINVESRKQYEAAIAAGAKPGGRRQLLVRGGPDGKAPSPEDIAKAQQEFRMREINRQLRKTAQDEKQIFGNLQKIECRNGIVTYTVKTESETFMLTSRDFQGLTLMSYEVDPGSAGISCNANISALKAVIVYKPKTIAKNPSRGELLSIEFVPADFRFLDAAITTESDVQTDEKVETFSAVSPNADLKEDFNTQRRNAMMEQIKAAMRKPLPGEKRELAFIEKSECSNKGSFFYFKTQTRMLKLSNPAAAKLEMRAFTQDVENLQIGCGMKAVEIPVVITYKDIPDKKSKADGELIALEFVPKNFVLEN